MGPIAFNADNGPSLHTSSSERAQPGASKAAAQLTSTHSASNMAPHRALVGTLLGSLLLILACSQASGQSLGSTGGRWVACCAACESNRDPAAPSSPPSPSAGSTHTHRAPVCRHGLGRWVGRARPAVSDPTNPRIMHYVQVLAPARGVQDVSERYTCLQPPDWLHALPALSAAAQPVCLSSDCEGPHDGASVSALAHWMALPPCSVSVSSPTLACVHRKFPFCRCKVRRPMLRLIVMRVTACFQPLLLDRRLLGWV